FHSPQSGQRFIERDYGRGVTPKTGTRMGCPIRYHSPPFCTYDLTNSSAFASSTESISSRRSSSSSFNSSPCLAGAATSAVSSTRSFGAGFCLRSRSGIFECSLSLQTLDQLGGGADLVEQRLHVRLRSLERLHHRDAPQRVRAYVED